MKLLTLIATTTFALTMTTANATDFVASNNSVETNLCMAIASNSGHEVRDEMKLNRVNKHTVNNKLRCNKLDVKNFTVKYDLAKSAKSLGFEIDSKTTIHDLSASLTAPVNVVGSR
ncbi:hypothetical protein PALB_28560 [Pseudoalteromonas luteoviolacea B = ATCC 29581]|nr:hypothetical protein PALB_28560 [Pseudoalteromonas luteoviolacea B = ATCC 29581]